MEQIGTSTEKVKRNLEKARIEERQPPSLSRRIWYGISMGLTFCCLKPFLVHCGRMERRDIRMAWREKVAICILIMLSCAFVLFFIMGLPWLICPKVNVLGKYEIADRKTSKDPYVIIYGSYYSVKDIYNSHVPIYAKENDFKDIIGQDVSQMFFPARNWDVMCPGITDPGSSWDNLVTRVPEKFWPHYTVSSKTSRNNNYIGNLQRYKRGFVGWTRESISANKDDLQKLIIIGDNVYDVAAYFMASEDFFDPNMRTIFSSMANKDATMVFKKLYGQNPLYYRNVLNCMNHMFFVGTVDHRNDIQCQATNWILLGASIVIVLTIGIKFLVALRGHHATNPEETPKFVIIQVPCYTENQDSLEKTIHSIARAQYDNKYKLMMLICDGYIIGQGNDKPTSEIAKDILYGPDKAKDLPSRESFEYQAIGDGSKQLNKAKLYSGLFNFEGQKLHFMIIEKIGTEDEKYAQKPGNRTKRDSQMILMRFLNKVYTEKKLTSLEYEMYRCMTEDIGYAPDNYEFILMVDADTEIDTDSINKLVSCMVSDQKIVGLCGETVVANEHDSWVTWIQIYEYFISHHLEKAFESWAGTVTCLPGCFSMYRVRTPGRKRTLLLVSNNIVNEYSDPNVNTLHKKNLLTLGEDRYLTTLVLKYAPYGYKTRYTPDAKCKTNAPHSYSDLLSQRRRWINSTIHNLFELMSLGNLCGCCCVGMRFLIMLQLIATVIGPATIVYLVYLIYLCVQIALGNTEERLPVIALVMIGSVYGVQMIIFIMRGQLQHFGNMVVYMFATPIYSMAMPLYSFWKMDDFSWGNTRRVDGNGVEDEYDESEDTYDITRIRTMDLADWQRERENGVSEYGGDAIKKHTGITGMGNKHSWMYPQSPMMIHPRFGGSQYGASMYCPTEVDENDMKMRLKMLNSQCGSDVGSEKENGNEDTNVRENLNLPMINVSNSFSGEFESSRDEDEDLVVNDLEWEAYVKKTKQSDI